MFDINDFRDDNVWDLICEGRTKGVFQLESNLGRHWAKKVSPRSINELAALLSLIRPGCLKAYKDGKSMTQHYADRKANLDPVAYEHESIEPILKETYGVLVSLGLRSLVATPLISLTLSLMRSTHTGAPTAKTIVCLTFIRPTLTGRIGNLSHRLKSSNL